MVITSLDNEKVKKYKKLKKRKYRDEYNEFIVEGMHAVIEAFKCGMIIELILEENEALPLDCPYVYVTKEIIGKISTMDTPSTVMALCKKFDEKEVVGNKILILDELQDPGNLGTIVRSAKAFNIDTIILSENTVDMYNPKVIRATQGMMFHINIIRRDIHTIIKVLKNMNIPIYGTDVNYGVDVRDLNKKDKEKFALIVGNEGNGVRRSVLEECDKNLYIEMNSKVESLNVGVAASILLYELGK
ncbi:MAG: RNA methyltransferase [Firmicutes bacterium]|nr:RNA methyltransferase [Bacillota bacterium]